MPKLTIPQGFTPGPWHVEYAELGAAIRGDDGKSMAAVWPTCLDGTVLPAEVNAALIALAPQMAARIEDLEAALRPFAEEAKFATHRPDGPGYLRKSDWQRVRDVMEGK